jgi:NADH-quinone oxidoreductase subunit J
MTQLYLFYVFAALVTFCSVMVVGSRNPVTSAVFLVFDLFLLAGIYAMMEAHFVAAIQVLVYAGAIVVLFVFVIMLLNLGDEIKGKLRISVPDIVMMGITGLSFVIIAFLVARAPSLATVGEMTPEAISAAGGNTYVVGMVLFTKYLWPFELASILILLAMVASIVIAKKEKAAAPARRRTSNANQ